MDAELERDLAGVRAAQDRVMDRVAGLTDKEARRPSRLPDWSVGHVLTHIARNGESVAWRLESSARGEVVDQYPGGKARRAADIEAGADRPAAELRVDLAATHDRIDAAVAAMPEAAWDAETRDTDGILRAARRLLVRRWREVEVHHADLGLGYEPADWPADFVGRVLPGALDGVGRRLPGLDRIDPATVLAWIYGRTDPPPGFPKLEPF